jgi:hypothetical protein
MKTLLYASGTDHGLVGRTTALNAQRLPSNGTPILCALNLTTSATMGTGPNEAWSTQTSGQAARLSPARGAIAGVLLGASLWGAILVLVGLIKL